MAALDTCNRRFGRGTVVRAPAGMTVRRTWSTTFERRSPRYATRPIELPVIGAASPPEAPASFVHRPDRGADARAASAQHLKLSAMPDLSAYGIMDDGGDDALYGKEGSNRFVFNPGDTDFRSNLGTGDTVMDFEGGTDTIDFASGPVGTSGDFKAAQSTSTDFAQIQALAQSLLSSAVSYAFVADGFLFTNGGNGTANVTDAVKLTGAGTASSFKYQDIAHGAMA